MAATSSSQSSFASQAPFPEPGSCVLVQESRPSTPTASAVTTQAEDMQLMEDYKDVIDAIVSELDALEAGELAILSIYVVEPGKSTNRLLAVLRQAAERGVRLELQCDFSLTSHVTRFFERTTTEAPALAAIAADFPSTCSFTPQSIPTHAKYAIFRRISAPDSAVFGGVNVGDRFSNWRDFAVRLRGQRAVDRLVSSVEAGSFYSGPFPAPACTDCDDVYQGLLSDLPAATAPGGSAGGGVAFCCNRPRAMALGPWLVGGRFPGEFQVKPSLVSLFSDPGIDSITMALAYIDSEGAAVIRLALDRGTEVRLVMPRKPNVYQSCNSRTLARLLEYSAASGGRLTLALHSDMLHAKSLVATRADGATVGLIGSCNFKCRSFGQFAELCAMFTDPQFNRRLEASIEALFSEAEVVRNADDLPMFDPTVAAIEHWLG